MDRALGVSTKGGFIRRMKGVWLRLLGSGRKEKIVGQGPTWVCVQGWGLGQVHRAESGYGETADVHH